MAARDFLALPPARPKPAKSGPGPESRPGRHARPRHRCMLASAQFKTRVCARASLLCGRIMHASPATSHHSAYGTVQGAYCLIRHGAPVYPCSARHHLRHSSCPLPSACHPFASRQDSLLGWETLCALGWVTWAPAWSLLATLCREVELAAAPFRALGHPGRPSVEQHADFLFASATSSLTCHVLR